jgi:hypothetical protein
MAWEKRGSNGPYYYRVVRVNGRVRKIYFGKGLTGELAASLDAAARRDREQRAAALRKSQERYQAALEPLHALEQCIGALVRLELVSAGYHYQWGKWRRRHAK